MTPSTAQKHRASSGHGEKLTRKASAAIAALMSEPTLAAAAAFVGISETTLWRWLQRDDFRQKLKEAQGRVFETALTSLKSSVNDAVSCLRRNLNCKRPSVQVQAARCIVEYALRAHETLSAHARIDELEARLQEREDTEKALKSLEERQSN